jgi:hypothetical protein
MIFKLGPAQAVSDAGIPSDHGQAQLDRSRTQSHWTPLRPAAALREGARRSMESVAGICDSHVRRDRSNQTHCGGVPRPVDPAPSCHGMAVQCSWPEMTFNVLWHRHAWNWRVFPVPVSTPWSAVRNSLNCAVPHHGPGRLAFWTCDAT